MKVVKVRMKKRTQKIVQMMYDDNDYVNMDEV